MQYPLLLSLTALSLVTFVRSQDCQLQVPANPLSPQGLATPYVLTGCNQLDFANQGTFVEAAILDPATGNIQIYNPLVINAGMVPVGNGAAASATSSSVASSTTTSHRVTTTKVARRAASADFYIPPILPKLPDNAVVGIWFGSNAASVTLTGNTGGCVNGLGNSVFGQFAYCNAQEWFNAAKTAVSQGLVRLPAPGTGTNGQACPTTHDFRVVDQDQSDNVVTTYLLIGNNTVAQNTPANNKANPNAQELTNASDNALITQFIDPTLGCAPYQNPCMTCPTGESSALATDELLANFFPPAGGPALIPLNDPMVLVNGQQSLQKVNLYRDGTGQPQADNTNASALTYCQQITRSGIFINENQQLFMKAGSPATNAANNLFTFLAMRFSASFGPAPGLGCTGLLNVANPVTLTTDGNGVVTAATINTQLLQQILTGAGGGTTTAGPSTSAPASTVASSVSTGMTAGRSITARPTGVLLHPTSTASSTPAALTSPSGSATHVPTARPNTSAGSAGAAASATRVPISSSIPTCTSAATVTVTVTACPTQAPPTAPSGRHGHHRKHWKRSIPIAAERVHRRKPIGSST